MQHWIIIDELIKNNNIIFTNDYLFTENYKIKLDEVICSYFIDFDDLFSEEKIKIFLFNQEYRDYKFEIRDIVNDYRIDNDEYQERLFKFIETINNPKHWYDIDCYLSFIKKHTNDLSHKNPIDFYKNIFYSSSYTGKMKYNTTKDFSHFLLFEQIKDYYVKLPNRIYVETLDHSEYVKNIFEKIQKKFNTQSIQETYFYIALIFNELKIGKLNFDEIYNKIKDKKFKNINQIFEITTNCFENIGFMNDDNISFI